MTAARTSGILLHPTSLPGPHGIGDLGPNTRRWLDWIAETGCGLWQVLPLGPTGYGDSPYQSFSSFAGNPNLISLTELAEHGLLEQTDFDDQPSFPAEHVDYGPVIEWKTRMLEIAHARFEPDASYAAFVADHEAWLDDFALFMALKEEAGGRPWSEWPDPLRDRDPQAIAGAYERLATRVDSHRFKQYLFHRQWGDTRRHAHEAGISIVGDLPIFVAHDSADVWVSPELFSLGSDGRPRLVAGVPPDYFSATGQLWGNPQYEWERHAADGYRWWLRRLRSVLDQVDIVRIDHFRAFADYWEIPAEAETAVTGRWRDGPGARFFDAVRAELGELPIIAEDLGELSDAVFDLRDRYGLPGMKILQFAFDDGLENPFLPHNYPENCVAYTGTHDNDTTLGWYETASESERAFARSYLEFDGSDVAWRFVEAVWMSRAAFALAPMQDLLSLPTTARMNLPGSPSGNWSWRMDEQAMSPDLANRLLDLNQRAHRTP